MLVFTNPLFSAQRPAFVEAFPIETAAHRAAQRGMFGAARAAGLPTDEKNKDAMLRGVNQLLGLRIESRRQLTVKEMEVVTVAIESGAVFPGWRIAPGFQVTVKTVTTVTISHRAADYVSPDYEGYDEHFPFI